MSAQRLAESIVGSPLRDLVDLSGGCIHTVQRATGADGAQVVIKSNTAEALAFFEEEALGLTQLAATETVCVPTPIGCAGDDECAVLVMPYLPPGAADAEVWSRFAEALAGLHLAEAGERYGFVGDNHLGPTPQPNAWTDGWVEFNAVHRLGHQGKLNRDAGRLGAGEVRELERLLDKLDTLIPDTPRPSLLHGDLWSGNALPTTAESGQATIALIDPACSIGDALADIAMMQLFGGFPESVFAIHASLIPESGTQRRERLDIYQLYHLLNHLLLFGSGYQTQVMATIRRYS
jgi:fructosamine-3-kinase